MPVQRPLFRGLTPRQWLNLLWAALAAFFFCFGGWYAATGGLWDYMGIDYRVFYSSARIAVERGFPQIYDPAVQDLYQRPLFETFGTAASRMPYVPYVMLYLPAFVLFFLPLAPLPYIPSYFVWITLNLALIVLYMFRFKRALGKEDGSDLLLQLLVCLPVFSNTFLGQVNGWMLIGMGEFLLLMVQGRDLPWSCRQSRLAQSLAGFRERVRERRWLHTLGRWAARGLDEFVAIFNTRGFRAGLWLGLLLLKPQTLVLILPGLLLSRRFKVLLGFAVSGLLIVLLSIILAGGYGLGDLAITLLRAVEGMPSNVPEAMMNWRSLAFNLGTIVPQHIAWAVSMGGLIMTAGLALSLWVRPAVVRERFPLILLGTYAATCAATWHSHIHMILPLIPLLLYLYARKQLPWQIAYLWLLAPPLVFPLMLIVKYDIAYNMMGLGMLALNLFLLVWVSWVVWKKR